MKLGELIKRLRAADPNKVVKNGFGRATSYRGYYDQVAFVPSSHDTTIGAMLDSAENAIGTTFTGYKGGEYSYDGDTEAWLADWGSCAPDDEPISEADVNGWVGSTQSSALERLRERVAGRDDVGVTVAEVLRWIDEEKNNG